MILGVGIDIIEIERIKLSIEKHGDRFLSKIFTPAEIDYCILKANKYQHFAARFSAKEAVSKALSSIWTNQFGWQDIEVYNEINGSPKITLSAQLLRAIKPDMEILISLSHSHIYVTAIAILQKKST